MGKNSLTILGLKQMVYDNTNFYRVKSKLYLHYSDFLFKYNCD